MDSLTNNILVPDTTVGSNKNFPYIKVPLYQEGVNYFALFVESEEKLNKLDYQKYSVEEVWIHHRESSEKKNDDNYYYVLYSRNLVVKYRQRNHSFMSDMDNMKKLNSTVEGESFDWAFITLNWDDTQFTVPQIMNASKKIMAKPWCGPGSLFVVEKHRTDGIHHHTHFLIKFAEKKSPSRIIDDIYALRAV